MVKQKEPSEAAEKVRSLRYTVLCALGILPRIASFCAEPSALTANIFNSLQNIGMLRPKNTIKVNLYLAHYTSKFNLRVFQWPRTVPSLLL